MKNLFVVLGIAVSVLLSSSAFAGTKDNTGTLHVKNDSTVKVGVIVDPAKTTYKDNAEFTKAGGRFLDPGESTDFIVKQGKHTVGGGTSFAGPFKSIAAEVIKGKTTNVLFSQLK